MAFFEIQCSRCEKIFKVVNSTDLLNESDIDFDIDRLQFILNNPKIIESSDNLYDIIDQYPEVKLFLYGDPPFHWLDNKLEEPCIGYASLSYTTKIISVHIYDYHKLEWVKICNKEINLKEKSND